MSGPGSGPWLVTGAGGMLGREVLAELGRTAQSGVGATRRQLDVTDPEQVRAAFRAHRPAVVVNCAAWTAVDDAEEQEAAAHAVNGRGPQLLAEECRRSGAVLLQLSTDYVFDGRGSSPYAEDAPVAPRSGYGRTKLAGETAVLHSLPESGYVVRTAWLYGATGKNFVRSIIRAERSKATVDIVDDQRGQPTWARDLAACLVRLGCAGRRGDAPAGVYHGTGGGDTTWYEFGRHIFATLGADPGRVRPTSSERLAWRAPRPAYSVLGHERWRLAGMSPLRPWRAAFREAFDEIRRAVT
jgi:dTDP-4-dehydrorhamnose reductase